MIPLPRLTLPPLLAPLAIALWCAAGIAAPQAAEANPAYVVPLKGTVNKPQFFFLRRALKEAQRNGADAVIIDMDTYGGDLNAAVQMSEALSKARMPTYTFIDSNAGSAGALISLATKNIYMAPDAAIGAAAPVLSYGEDLPSTMKDKVVSYFSAKFRSTAEQNGHRPEIAQAFMDKEKEVKIGKEIINKKGSLLTLSAREATRVIDGKPVLAAGIVEGISALADKVGLRGELVNVKPTGFENLAAWITALAPVLLLGGILCAYIEFKIPGFGIFGIGSICCFTIFFLGQYVAGLAGWEAVALFVVGLVFVLLEVLVFPHVILGIGGAMLMLGALAWAMVDHFPGQPVPFESVKGALLKLGLTLAASVIGGAVLARFLPRTSIYKRLVLATAISSGPAFAPATEQHPHPLLGGTGIARTALRPSGKAEIDGQLVDVVTPGTFVPAGARVQVVQIEGSRIVVQESA